MAGKNLTFPEVTDRKKYASGDQSARSWIAAFERSNPGWLESVFQSCDASFTRKGDEAVAKQLETFMPPSIGALTGRALGDVRCELGIVSRNRSKKNGNGNGHEPDRAGLNSLAKRIAALRAKQGTYTPSTIAPEPAEIELKQNDAMLGKLMLVTRDISFAASAVVSNDRNKFRADLVRAAVRILDIAGTLRPEIDFEALVLAQMAEMEGAPSNGARKTSL